MTHKASGPNLPALPPLDPYLVEMVFTHSTAIFEIDGISGEEKKARKRRLDQLEWEGDAVVRLCTTRSLLAKFPDTTTHALNVGLPS
jgi:dsRNA-specific ribonuclease